MDKKLEAGLKSLPAYAVAVFIFRLDARRSLEIMVVEPLWLRRSGWGPMLPEAVPLPGETIELCAKRIVEERTGSETGSELVIETRPRIGGPMIGATTICAVCVPRSARAALITSGERVSWRKAESINDLLSDQHEALSSALQSLASQPREVGVLIGNDVFTMTELRDELNEIRRLAGIKGRVDIRNLRRQLADADWLEEVGQQSKKVGHRPAKLYRVRDAR